LPSIALKAAPKCALVGKVIALVTWINQLSANNSSIFFTFLDFTAPTLEGADFFYCFFRFYVSQGFASF
jgi:hypothetical protein